MLLEDSQEHPLVLVLPGGGYGALAPHEADPVAQAFRQRGFHAAVLRYRLAPRYRHPAMLNDAQRAMRIIRSNAAAWKIKSGKVAVLGFSAGGHLASTLALHHNKWTNPHDDLAATQSARPDAAVLCYAVLDFIHYTHQGSRDALLPEPRDAVLTTLLSSSSAVTPQCPPTFLWHTSDDAGVPVQAAFAFASLCRDHKVPVELHAYESGPHGIGLAPDHPQARQWPDLAAAFLQRHLNA